MQSDAAISDMHIIWLTAGLGCDGDTIAMTAATQPSIEDLLLGALPGIPRVHLHNPVLAYEVGDDFVRVMRRAAAGELGPFILVVEGSIPNEANKAEGYWAAVGTDEATGQPITTCEWIDRLAPRAWAAMGAGTCATYRGCLYRLHHARLPRQVHALHGRATGRAYVDGRRQRLRQDHSITSSIHPRIDEPRTRAAGSPRPAESRRRTRRGASVRGRDVER